MKNGFVILWAVLCLCQISNAQKVEKKTTEQLAIEKIIKATRIDSEVNIDGKLDEAMWAQAETVSDFVAWSPNPGVAPANQTEVKLLYDNDAIYIGAYMKESSRDDISTQLSQRDQLGNTDWFGIILDTYGNANDASEFIVGATGVQFDAKLANNEDTNWDAVWFSNVQLTDNGWYVEMKIPYSAIRFAKADEQKWKLNFIRKANRLEEKSSWYPIDPEAAVWLAQSGTTSGIVDITPPPRLSISPYVSLYAQRYSDNVNDIRSSGFTYNGGMDLKYGINDAFTLDMTLVPDFGQVQSDDQVLNLSPFEIRFDEQRQFFTEGTELFNKGNLFYSRRVGGSPIGKYDVFDNLGDNEEVTENPNNARLYNATKVSGRLESGLGIGVFNALSRSTYATVTNVETSEERKVATAPITNYNVVVLDQTLKNNSTISIVNTNVTRFGSKYYDANVTGAQFNIKTKSQKWSVSGEAALSQKYYADTDNDFGLAYELGIRKISGNLNYGISYEQTGESFDPNDLGFQRFGNEREFSANAYYGQYDEFGPFTRGNFWFNYSYSRIINPDVFSDMHFNTGFWMQTKEFFNINMWANYEPTTYNYYEPRVWGMYYQEPAWGNVGLWMGTDNRKKFRISGYVDYRKTNEDNRYGIGINLNPRYRVSDKLTFDLDFDYDEGRNDPRFVTIMTDDEIVFGRRNRTTVTNSLSADYTFNDKMSLDFRLRHYWSKVVYNGFSFLSEDGGLTSTDYDEFNDFSFGLLNIDLNYKWRFAPGSDIIINWKNSISGSIADPTLQYDARNYFDGIKSLSEFPQNNSISVRVVYYLDYQNFKDVF